MSNPPRDRFRPVDPESLGVESHHAEVDPETPSPARMYDYYLGGKDNFESDRRAAEEIYTQIPDLPEIARDNRGMMQRAVRFMASQGITQFVDIGTGLPTQGNVHEIAQGLNPESIFGNAKVREIIDMGKPIGLILVAVLHFIAEDEDPYGLLARYRSYLPPGSYLVLAHASRENRPEEAWRKMEAVYERSSARFTFRGQEQVRRLFDGFELVEPGLVYCPEWRPDPGTRQSPSAPWNFGGVGYLP